MAMDFRAVKAQMKPVFHREFEKYYPVKSLRSVGFERRVCSCCGRGFWTAQPDRTVCDEPSCSGGYRFIGERLTRKPFGYKEAWDVYVDTFRKWDYVPIQRYPVVCRWYEDLYFVSAGINDFQPYVVAGEMAPPAPAVLEPQFCLRFQDIDSVGITGRHYTGFIMVGQHTFNTEKKYVYFKDEGILQMHEFLTKGLGIPAHEIVYHEDVWAGGGNFGPSMEFFSRGLELGNQVYMQYELLPDGSHRELKTRVIDMGAGLERWSWFSQGVPMSYDTVFPKVMKFLYGKTGVSPDKRLWAPFARYAGLLNVDEVDDVGGVWAQVAGDLDVPIAELKKEVFKMRAIYAIGEHTRNVLVAVHDGALPSNVGGGYNLRNLLRRCWGFIDEYGFDVELEDVLEEHVKEFGSWFTDLKDTGSLMDIISVEHERYREGRKKGDAIVRKLVESKIEFTADRLVELYDSQGIPPDLIKSIKQDILVPDNFYQLVEQRHQDARKEEVKIELPPTEGIQETNPLYYDPEYYGKTSFTANALAVLGDWVILDQTLFYPEGGGQEKDVGTLNGVRVLDVQKAGKGVVLHRVETPTTLRMAYMMGAEVIGEIDGGRRRQLMQHHTSTHIVNAAAKRVLGPHIWQAGANKSVDMARLDVTHYKAVSSDELKRIEDEANKIVKEAHPVNKLILPRDEAERKYGFTLYQGGAVPGLTLRVIDIPGVDAEACGGTHLNNTSEAEVIKIVRAKRIQDGVVRIEFKAGEAAKMLSDVESGLAQQVVKLLDEAGFAFVAPVNPVEDVASISRLLKVQPDKIPPTIERFIKELRERNGKLAALGLKPAAVKSAGTLPESCVALFDAWKESEKILSKEGEKSAGDIAAEIEKKFSSSLAVKHVTHAVNVKQLTETAKQLTEKPGRFLLILNVDGPKVNVVAASSDVKRDAGEVVARLSKELGGGGRGDARGGLGGGKSDGAQEKFSGFKV
ncbi:Alanine--tRNA ligase [uncultured archaeon]|nr:Alanine--tRNA ligase [uncultured archaeon]